ncbi:uncharacterized protein ACA1_217160 [Acanthamoeba castellanii str. Neff]|uniref:Uncharacterized protein n=1 Tax=Acanthamoeba castellanii (strain ATCC 30010 / Neff) TaxID=1257118 RepID=L8GPR1_ACACF|nr:uncharacterized protein ACA1_217160 [Acanthamoeba castellanii str. Neff]ELR15154.1 hypothetical protein ACA1_217160 [Acanthamoeba castellanii str. Neff]
MADERRQALTRIIGERLSNCFGLGNAADQCVAVKGENDEECLQLESLRLHCFAELLCPQQAQRAVTCLQTRRNPSLCQDDIKALRACTGPAFDHFVDRYPQHSLGDASKCQVELKEVDLCVGSVICPAEGRTLGECLRNGTEDSCASQRQAFSACVAEGRLKFWEELGIPVNEFAAKQ